MSIAVAELNMNLSKYLELSQREDVYIIENGKIIAKLSNPNADRVEMAKSLFGIIPANVTLDEAKTERADNIWLPLKTSIFVKCTFKKWLCYATAFFIR